MDLENILLDLLNWHFDKSYPVRKSLKKCCRDSPSLFQPRLQTLFSLVFGGSPCFATIRLVHELSPCLEARFATFLSTRMVCAGVTFVGALSMTPGHSCKSLAPYETSESYGCCH